MKWVAGWWLAALIAACGDGGGGSSNRNDAAAAGDAGGAAGDSGGPDGATECADSTSSIPVPPQCAQTELWASYIADEIPDQEFREEFFVVRMGEERGEPLVASGGHGVMRTNRPTWGFSPDGGSIAFVSRDGNLPWQVYTAPLTAAGPGTLRTVSGPFKVDGNVLWYAWSPDGRRIAYIADQAYESYELWVVDLASEGYAQRVNPPLEFDGGVGIGYGQIPFAWSPDGTKLLFAGSFSEPERMELYVVDVSAEAPGPSLRLMPNLDGTVRRIAWTPDGRAVVFSLTGADGGLYLARVSCSGIDGPHLISDSARIDNLSPDGRELYYLAEASGGEALYRADLTRTPPVSMVISESIVPPVDIDLVWSPTGIRLAVRNYGRLHLLDGITGEKHLLDGPNVTGRSVHSFAWSPDGNSIAYTANQDGSSKFEAFHVDLAGDTPGRRRRVNAVVDHDIYVDSLLWSPDSTHLAFRANQDVAERFEVYAAERLAGVPGSVTKLNSDLLRDGASVVQFRWSPQATQLLYVANDAGAFIHDAFVVDLDAPGQATPVNSAPNAVEVGWAPCPTQ